jgi:endonuclease/exonuclease/phosphatase family metal-dependent hydrolase
VARRWAIGSVPGGLPVAQVLAFAAALELLLQCLRAFFPLGYHLVGSLGFVVTPLVLVTVFLAPLLLPLLQAALGARAVLALLAALLVARLLLQAAPGLGVAIAAVVVGLLAIGAVLPAVAAGRFGPDVLASGTLVGLGADVALRSWRATDDVVWSHGIGAWLDPSLVAPVLVLAAALPALARAEPPTPSQGRAPVWTWTVLLMPQLLLWTSPAFVGSSAEVGLPLTTAVLLGSVAVGMAVLAWRGASHSLLLPVAGVLGAALGMAWASGAVVLLLAGIGTIAAALLLRRAAVAARGPFAAWRHAGASVGAWVTMFVLLLLYPLHYEIPLPIDNRWLPALAVVLACLPLLARRAAAADYRCAEPSALHAPALAITGAGAVILAGLIQAGIVGGSLSPGPDPELVAGPSSDGPLVVATYNTGQGQDASTGGLAFRRVAEAIVGLDADVIALQEVARGWPLTAMADFDAWLRATTDYRIDYLPAADHQFGNAVVTRVPIAEITGLDLGQQGGAQRRSAIRALLADGTTVYATHLQARNSEAAEQSRLDQMRQIIADWGGRPTTVIAGDLNPRNEYVDASETPPKRISNLEVFLDAGFTTTQPTSRCTEPTSNDNCSDYVFGGPDVAFAGANDVRAVEVSDHRPVVARFAAD